MTISCLTNMVFGTFILFLTNSCILHQYMNLMGELTRFADRHFYEVRPRHRPLQSNHLTINNLFT